MKDINDDEITDLDRTVIRNVLSNTLRRISSKRIHMTNVYLDEKVYTKGEIIGPSRQNILADKPSILVFVDDNPLANFSHGCRYLLHDPKTGKLYKEIPAHFPPFVKKWPPSLKAIHEPIHYTINPALFDTHPEFRCPVDLPSGERYAILFSGMSNRRHLNDLEFLYRTLVDSYSFDKNNIYALNYDGSINTTDGVQSSWPGDFSPFRIKVTGQGTRIAFEEAIEDLKGKITKKDLLLIHTNNHGGYDSCESDLATYPNMDGYKATDFANKVGQLPKFSKLIVMMEQCHSGGFNTPIIANSRADATSIASAALEPNLSYASMDLNWDVFARDWIAAQTGVGPSGDLLAFNPDTNSNGRIEAEEAFDYANTVKWADDTPNFAESSEDGGNIWLGQEYVTWPWWCSVLSDNLDSYQRKLSPDEYNEKFNKAHLELSKLTASLDKISADLREEYTKKVKDIVARFFD
jgi:hypothetical protein